MGILSGLHNNGAKMVLKINLEGISAVKMQLVAINKDCVKSKKDNNYNYYKDIDSEFVIWSTQDFVFNERQIRLPDELNIKDLMVFTHKFKHDMERYDTLKKMYDTLIDWSFQMDMFSTKTKNNDIVVTGDYWFVT